MSTNANNTSPTPYDLVTARMAEVVGEPGVVALGNGSVVDQLQWHKGDRSSSFVATKAEVDRASAAGEQPMPVVLVAFGKIDTDNFFLNATCGYTGPTIITPMLCGAKGNCVITTPALGGLVDSAWAQVVQNVDLLRDNVSNDAKKNKVGAIDGAGAQRAIKIRHVWAEPIAEDVQVELRENDDDPNDALGAPFLMADWPCPNPAVRAELDELVQKKTHRAVPIPAYDTQGDIMAPGDYQSKLPGAIVEARFTLSHVKVKGTHYFSADVAQLDLLVDAPIAPRPSPIKRGLADISLVSPK